LYANLRPVLSLPRLSPRQDVDFIILRENSEGLYSGRERMENGAAIAERVITRQASERLAQKALEIMLATGRRRMTIVHKANILPLTDGLFRDSVRQTVLSTPATEPIEVDELLVDTAALKIIQQPQRFDLVITTNLFGDILSDEAAYWCGGMGLAPSLNWGDGRALAEPVHGSAPDIAGKGIANPIAAILSAALLARYQWKMSQAAAMIESAVFQALAEDIPVIDGAMAPENTTELVTNTILSRVLQLNHANLAQTENLTFSG
jgi:homoisocitrate dehydrogenase